MDWRLIAVFFLFLQSCSIIQNPSVSQTPEEHQVTYQISESDSILSQTKTPKEILLMLVDIKGGVDKEQKDLWISLTILDFGLKLRIQPVTPFN